MRPISGDLQAGPAGDAVGGELIGGPGKRPTTFASGRVCEEPGCATRLSIYNSRTHCAAHDFDASLMNFRCPNPAPNTDAQGQGIRHPAAGAGIAQARRPHPATPRRVRTRPAAKVTARRAKAA